MLAVAVAVAVVSAAAVAVFVVAAVPAVAPQAFPVYPAHQTDWARLKSLSSDLLSTMSSQIHSFVQSSRPSWSICRLQSAHFPQSASIHPVPACHL